MPVESSVTFNANGQKSNDVARAGGWFDVRDGASFIVSGVFNMTIAVDYSNVEALDKDTNSDYVTDQTTYTTPDGPRQIPAKTCRYARFRVTAYVSGLAKVVFLEPVAVQTAKTPAPSNQGAP